MPHKIRMMYKLLAATAVSFLAFLLWIIYLANTGRGSIFFDFVKSFPLGDKVGHLGLFGFFTFTAVIGLKFRTLKLAGVPVYLGSVLVFLFAAGEELTQVVIPNRTFDLVDLAADILGILLATGLAAYVSAKILKLPPRNASIPDS